MGEEATYTCRNKRLSYKKIELALNEAIESRDWCESRGINYSNPSELDYVLAKRFIIKEMQHGVDKNNQYAPRSHSIIAETIKMFLGILPLENEVFPEQ